jgi:hypothetical protein
VKAHLKPGGVYYFNTTNSTAALKTAMSAFPFGVRFRNFAALSEAPLSFDRLRFREVLEGYRIDKHPVLDQRSPSDRSMLDRVVNDSAVEVREDILRRLDTTRIITDDNMLTEWHPTPDE